jgi:hypothetical protein
MIIILRSINNLRLKPDYNLYLCEENINSVSILQSIKQFLVENDSIHK